MVFRAGCLWINPNSAVGIVYLPPFMRMTAFAGFKTVKYKDTHDGNINRQDSHRECCTKRGEWT